MSSHIDERLLERARDGDVKAFVAILKAHSEELRSLAYSILHDANYLDDAMQEAFIRAFRHMPEMKTPASLRAWLHRVVYTTCIDELRRRQRVTPMDVNGHFENEPYAPSVEDFAVAKQMINSVLWQLPPTQRAAVMLVDGYGFDYATASRIMATPAGTVASRVNTARVALRRMLSLEEGSQSNDAV